VWKRDEVKGFDSDKLVSGCDIRDEAEETVFVIQKNMFCASYEGTTKKLLSIEQEVQHITPDVVTARD
jgi:hypothetical protein